MESGKAIKIVVDYFSSDNLERISEEAQIIKKIYCKDSEENYGRMKDFLEYLIIYDNNQLEINIRETNLTSGQ